MFVDYEVVEDEHDEGGAAAVDTEHDPELEELEALEKVAMHTLSHPQAHPHTQCCDELYFMQDETTEVNARFIDHDVRADLVQDTSHRLLDRKRREAYEAKEVALLLQQEQERVRQEQPMTPESSVRSVVVLVRPHANVGETHARLPPRQLCRMCFKRGAVCMASVWEVVCLCADNDPDFPVAHCCQRTYDACSSRAR
jgi:hypothetical protein